MVHSFEINGYRMALDSASGAVHVLSETAFNLLKKLEEKGGPLTKEAPDFVSCDELESYEELYQLYEDGTLFSEDMPLTAPAAGVVKSMCLHISHDCNMRCRYCFAGTGDFHRGRKLMSYEMGCKAIDFLLEKSGYIKNLELDFFGGEPLLNFDVVKRLVAYGREAEKPLGKNIRFTITTNGALLDDDAIAFINENRSNAVLSVDGRKCVNDGMRTFVDGSGTYDTIIPSYKKLVKDRTADWYVRGTYTRENTDFSEDVLSLANEGFDQISVEPVVLDNDDPLSIREEDLPKLFAEYEKLAAEMAKRITRDPANVEEPGKNGRFNFFHFMVDLDAGPCVYKRVKGCGSGSEYVAITPDGDIYPCHQFVGYTEFKMGNIVTGEFNRDIQKQFAGNSIVSMPHCQKCWAKYFCGGGCAANNYKFHKDLTVPYTIACELEKKRVECALMLKAAEAEAEADE
nr:thioether cross-link-forming SCIFF peptide maturase [Clostridia bacterium]